MVLRISGHTAAQMLYSTDVDVVSELNCRKPEVVLLQVSLDLTKFSRAGSLKVEFC